MKIRRVRNGNGKIDGTHVWRTKAGDDRIVKPDHLNQKNFPPKNNKNKTPKKVRSRKKTMPRTEENNAQSDPQSDAEHENENDTIENETYSYCINWDDEFVDDMIIN